MKRIKPFLPAISIFCIALLVRLVYNLTVARHYYPLVDSLGYQDRAFNMLDEHCFCGNPYQVTVVRAPLWPFLIAGLSLIVGRANIFDRLFLCCADAGTCVLIYLFARDLFNKRIGLIAGLSPVSIPRYTSTLVGCIQRHSIRFYRPQSVIASFAFNAMKARAGVHGSFVGFCWACSRSHTQTDCW